MEVPAQHCIFPDACQMSHIASLMSCLLWWLYLSPFFISEIQGTVTFQLACPAWTHLFLWHLTSGQLDNISFWHCSEFKNSRHLLLITLLIY